MTRPDNREKLAIGQYKPRSFGIANPILQRQIQGRVFYGIKSAAILAVPTTASAE
jgi:hypothetical protein